jgi:putative ABC transport system permease protein
VQVAADHSGADLVVDGFARDPSNPDPGKAGKEPTTADQDAVTAVLDEQPGTAHYYGVTETDAVVAGVSGNPRLSEFTASPAWSGYELISGRWFTRPGEAVVPTELLRATDRQLGDTLTVTTNDGTTSMLRIVGEVFDPGNNDFTVLAQAAADARPASWQVAVTDGTDPAAYATAARAELTALGLTAHVIPSDGADELVVIIDALAGLLTLLLVTVAGLGVLNAVVLDVRDRVHDIGIHKALGMTPRQTLTAVLASVALIGLVGGVLGVPAGLVLHGILVPAMGHGAGTELPAVVLTVYHPVQLVVLAVGGLVLAVAGALLPAGWAAKTRTATALRTE